MSGILLDTHALLWALTEPSRLSATAHEVIGSSAHLGEPIWFSSISLAEVVYLQDKGRLSPDTLSRIILELFGIGSAYREMPLTSEVAEKMQSVPRSAVPDLPDRTIAATALHLNVPLVTKDGRIRSLPNLRTIW